MVLETQECLCVGVGFLVEGPMSVTNEGGTSLSGQFHPVGAGAAFRDPNSSLVAQGPCRPLRSSTRAGSSEVAWGPRDGGYRCLLAARSFASGSLEMV